MKQTPLYSFHTRQGARMVDFAGWEMPLMYTSIIEEHHYTRRVASFFDISHMGRLEIKGQDAEGLLQHVCTRQLGDAKIGQSRYSHLCNEQGGILDDIIVSRYEDRWLVVCNASNRDKVVAWLRQHGIGRSVTIEDKTESTLMVALQGPQAIRFLAGKLPMPVEGLGPYWFITGSYMFVAYTIFRSGYTGEDGIEVILPAMLGSMAGNLLVSGESEPGPRPAGLGARDTLRLEAAMPLYGHELNENIDTISAGLNWCVDLEKDFIGADALRRIAREGPRIRLVGLELEGRRIARQHAKVLAGEKRVGEVTSGTFGPTLQKSIALAYVEAERAEPGQVLQVDLGSTRAEAQVVKLPFYKRTTREVGQS